MAHAAQDIEARRPEMTDSARMKGSAEQTDGAVKKDAGTMTGDEKMKRRAE
ncbi:hypothetical protein [Teichococcus aestuarii]|nr:hypothetical protein [Pseudoroseomonas aestuarii]